MGSWFMDPLRRHPLAAFFALAFAFSWWPWPLVALNPESTPMVPFGPLLAALVVVPIAGGRRGLADLLHAVVRWRVAPRWYAVALLLPAAITLLAVVGNVLLGAGNPWPALRDDWSTLLPGLAITLLVKGPLWEEPGWRGFALPRLLGGRSPLAASLVLGVVWAAWHLPLLVSEATAQRPPAQFVLVTVAYSLLFTWLYGGTGGSVLLVILCHAAFNRLAEFAFPAFAGATYGRLWWLYAAAMWTTALAVALGAGRLPIRRGSPPARATTVRPIVKTERISA